MGRKKGRRGGVKGRDPAVEGKDWGTKKKKPEILNHEEGDERKKDQAKKKAKIREGGAKT